jgi:hypothetical protein
MKPVLYLRIASVLAFIHAVLHTIGGVFGKPAPGVQAATVLVMQTNQFPLMGFTRSFWDFYLGMGLAVSIFLTVEALVFWQLAALAKTQAWELRPILATFAVGYLVFAVDSYRFFFFGPVVTEILIALSLGIAILTAKPSGASPAGA